MSKMERGQGYETFSDIFQQGWTTSPNEYHQLWTRWYSNTQALGWGVGHILFKTSQYPITFVSFIDIAVENRYFFLAGGGEAGEVEK